MYFCIHAIYTTVFVMCAIPFGTLFQKLIKLRVTHILHSLHIQVIIISTFYLILIGLSANCNDRMCWMKELYIKFQFDPVCQQKTNHQKETMS